MPAGVVLVGCPGAYAIAYPGWILIVSYHRIDHVDPRAGEVVYADGTREPLPCRSTPPRAEEVSIQ